MPWFTDPLGKEFQIKAPPQRIVSLVPSQTELLSHLGLDSTVVGITKFCVHPNAWFRSKTRVGGTKSVKPQIIQSLQPDLIIANKEENQREQIEELARQFPVWMSDVRNLDDALNMINTVGSLTFTSENALRISARIRKEFAVLKPAQPAVKAAYLIWKDPYMAAGSDTFINDMMHHCGFINIMESTSRYPEISIQQLQHSGCRLLLLSSEPFPFKQAHADKLRAELPQVAIMLVDGELFSWYGSRLQFAPAYFQKLVSSMGALLANADNKHS